MVATAAKHALLSFELVRWRQRSGASASAPNGWCRVRWIRRFEGWASVSYSWSTVLVRALQGQCCVP